MPWLVNGYLNYKGNSTSILWKEMTWVCSPEILISTYQMTWCCDTKDHSINLYCQENPPVLCITHLHKCVLHLLRAGFLKAFVLVYHQMKFKNFHVHLFCTNSLRTKWAIRHWNLWQTSSKLWVNFIGNKKFEIWGLKCLHSWGDTSPLWSE